MDDISGNIDQRLLEAYLATSYEVKQLGISIKIGQSNWHLEEFLVDNNIFSWAFISAFNPYSQEVSLEKNEAKHLEFCKMLDELNLVYIEGFGVPAADNWKPEKSLLILGVSKKKAIFFGKKMEQHAIVWGRLGGVGELIWVS